MQKVKVFQQNGIGERKIQGIRRFGKKKFNIDVISIDNNLPLIIDDSSKYLSVNINADIVLDFLFHPDLSYDLAIMCRQKKIPVIASGKRSDENWSLKPPI